MPLPPACAFFGRDSLSKLRQEWGDVSCALEYQVVHYITRTMLFGFRVSGQDGESRLQGWGLQYQKRRVWPVCLLSLGAGFLWRGLHSCQARLPSVAGCYMCTFSHPVPPPLHLVSDDRCVLWIFSGPPYLSPARGFFYVENLQSLYLLRPAEHERKIQILRRCSLLGIDLSLTSVGEREKLRRGAKI